MIIIVTIVVAAVLADAPFAAVAVILMNAPFTIGVTLIGNGTIGGAGIDCTQLCCGCGCGPSRLR